MTDSKKKWLVLVLFMVVAGLNQALWLNFAPLLTWVQSTYAVSEGTASLLVLVFPIAYVLLSVHAGRLTDARGYRFAIGLGAVVMAAFAALRVVPGGFWILVVAQTGIAVAQPYIVNGISKLVADWFPAEQSALATGLGTMGMFIGMAVGMGATPPLVEALGFLGAMGAFGAASVVAAVLFFVVVKERGVSSSAQAPAARPLRALMTVGQMWLLFVVAFLGLGFFNGLTTWLEPMLAPHGFDTATAGNIGAVLIVGGIVGSIVIPALSDVVKRRKPFLVASVVLSSVALVPMLTTTSQTVAMVSSAALGFFFLPALALLLDMCAAVAGAADAGGATGLLMLFGNLGGVVISVAMVAVKGDAPTFERANVLLYVVCVLSILGAVALRETGASTTAAAPAGASPASS